MFLSTIRANRTESATLQMIRGEVGIRFSSLAVLTAAIKDAAIRSAFFCRESSVTSGSLGEQTANSQTCPGGTVQRASDRDTDRQLEESG